MAKLSSFITVQIVLYSTIHVMTVFDCIVQDGTVPTLLLLLIVWARTL